MTLISIKVHNGVFPSICILGISRGFLVHLEFRLDKDYMSSFDLNCFVEQSVRFLTPCGILLKSWGPGVDGLFCLIIGMCPGYLSIA